MLEGVVVVLHSFRPAEVAAFSVGISLAYSVADDGGGSRDSTGKMVERMDDDMNERLEDGTILSRW